MEEDVKQRYNEFFCNSGRTASLMDFFIISSEYEHTEPRFNSRLQIHKRVEKVSLEKLAAKHTVASF